MICAFLLLLRTNLINKYRIFRDWTTLTAGWKKFMGFMLDKQRQLIFFFV